MGPGKGFGGCFHADTCTFDTGCAFYNACYARISRFVDELQRHQAPRYRDPDREDRGALNCRCGERIPPRDDGIRNWDAYLVHIAIALDEIA